jgi:hypothetical protein
MIKRKEKIQLMTTKKEKAILLVEKLDNVSNFSISKPILQPTPKAISKNRLNKSKS